MSTGAKLGIGIAIGAGITILILLLIMNHLDQVIVRTSARRSSDLFFRQ
jgi:hypothetical protein